MTNHDDTAAELLELAEASDDLATRAKALGLRHTERQLDRLSKLLRASRTRLSYQPTHHGVASAYIATALDTLTTAAIKIGAHA